MSARALVLLAACSLAAACGRSGPLEELGGTGLPLPRSPGIGTPAATPTPDPFGDGSEGDLDLDGEGASVNECAVLASAAGTALDVASVHGFAAGDLLLVWQVQDVFATVGDGAPVTADSAAAAGRWELTRAVTVAGPAIGVEAIAGSYETNGFRRAQVCRVPEYEDVTIRDDSAIVAGGWNGSIGGIVAFAVSGRLTLDGAVSADAAGFRGGVQSASSLDAGVTALDSANANQGGGRGEGLDPTLFGRYCRGNVANGAGGGNAHNAGGGGGANGGAGGLGGSRVGTPIDPLSQGLGGAAVALDGRLVPGGGGGGGHRNNDQLHDGGRGGGVVLVLAREIEGGGVISADGQAGNPSPARGIDGAGGGGAGGTVHLFFEESGSFTGSVTALGGGGGLADANGAGPHGPGGGGGGGVVRLTSQSDLPASVAVSGGAAGDNPSGALHGATAGAAGVVEQ